MVYTLTLPPAPVDEREIMRYMGCIGDDAAVTELIRRGISLEELHKLTMITPLFLECFKAIVDMEDVLKTNNDVKALKAAKEIGFSDQYIAKLWGVKEIDVWNASLTITAPWVLPRS